MVKVWVTGLLLLLTLLESACGNAKSSKSWNQEVIVTGQADGAPAGCDPDDIVQRMVDMFEAISRGETDVVDEFFGQKNHAPFAWYSMTEFGLTEADKNHFVAYTWDELAVYLEQRYQQHERLQLRSIQFNGWEQGRGIVHFGPMVISREADDLRSTPGGPEHLAKGKGAYHCKTQSVVALSLGMSETQVTYP